MLVYVGDCDSLADLSNSDLVSTSVMLIQSEATQEQLGELTEKLVICQ